MKSCEPKPGKRKRKWAATYRLHNWLMSEVRSPSPKAIISKLAYRVE